MDRIPRVLERPCPGLQVNTSIVEAVYMKNGTEGGKGMSSQYDLLC